MKSSAMTITFSNEGTALLGRQRLARLEAGAIFTPREFVTTSGERLRVPDANRIVHLQFRRFAGCPVCTMHLNAVAKRYEEIVAVGVREVVFFYSTAEDIRTHTVGLPFAFVPDPNRHVYLDYAVHAAPRALLNPRAWWPITKAVAHGLAAIARGRQVPPLNPRGSRFGLPADILIASDGRIIASKYGVHVHDQWSVDELLKLVRSYRRQ